MAVPDPADPESTINKGKTLKSFNARQKFLKGKTLILFNARKKFLKGQNA